MRRGLAAAAAAWGLACAGAAGAPTSAEAPDPTPALPVADAGHPSLVLLVAVAALTAERVEPGSMPTLAALAAAGAMATALDPVAPASPHPSAASLVSGRAPGSHGIVADRLLGDRGVRPAPYDHASQLRGPTLWSVLAERGRPVAALGWPTTRGAAIPLLVPGVRSVRPGQTWMGALAPDLTPELAAPLQAGGGADQRAAFPGAWRDAALTSAACAVVARPAPPSLVLLYLEQGRVAAQRHGPEAAEAAEAFLAADMELRRLIACLDGARRLASAAIVVVGDQGLGPLHGSLLPNALLAEAGLLASNGRGGVRSWRALVRSNGGSAFVYARGEPEALRAREVLLAESRRSGLFRVVSAEEMLGLGADPGAWFGLEARPGWAFANDTEGPQRIPSAARGVAGYLTASVPSALVAWGRGIRAGVRVPWMRLVDVAPTVARLLGVELPEGEGGALVGVLRLPVAADRDGG